MVGSDWCNVAHATHVQQNTKKLLTVCFRTDASARTHQIPRFRNFSCVSVICGFGSAPTLAAYPDTSGLPRHSPQIHNHRQVIRIPVASHFHETWFESVVHQHMVDADA